MRRFPHTRHPDRDWWTRLWPDPAGTLARLGLSSGTTLADVGCGDGHFTLAAAELVTPATVYAVDLDPAVLAELGAATGAAGRDGIVPVEGDARRLDELLPEAVDAVLVANTFHGIEEPAAFAERVGRVLRPDGRLLIVNWHDRPPEATPVDGQPRGPPAARRLSPHATVRAVAPAGFSPTRLVDLPPHHYGVVLDRSGLAGRRPPGGAATGTGPSSR